MGYVFTQYSNKSGVDVSVVQSTGTSTVDVMSQDATTRELNYVKRAINKSASALLELQNGIITPVGSFQTDSSVAYVKDVPENALPRAELKKVGGITKKTGSSTNLLPYPYPSNATTITGITFTDRGDGSIEVSGTAKDYVIYVLASEGSVNFGNSNMSAGISFGAGDNYVLSGGTDHVTIQYLAETRECLLTIAEGVTVDDEVVYPMVNTGMFPETWEPYKAPKLYTAKVTEVESVGANKLGGIALANRIKEVNPNTVIDTSAKTVKYYSGEISDKVLFTNFEPNTQYTLIFKGYANANFLNLVLHYTDGTRGDFDNFAESDKVGTIRFVSDKSKSIKSLNGIWFDGYTTLYYDECGIFEGDVRVQDFKPYFNHTLPIPEAVQALDGYGLGVSDTVYTYIDWEKKQFVKRCPSVDLGTLEWSYGSGLFASQDLRDIIKKAKDNSTVVNILTSKYQITSRAGVATIDKSICCDPDGDLDVNDSSYTDAETFKQAMSGVMLVYELATPEVTDISQYITDDDVNVMKVGAGGTITFKNGYAEAVPSEIEYQVGA